MKKVNVPVLWDSNGNFRNNLVYSISVGSIISGVEPKLPTPTKIPGYPGPTEVNTLLVIDPTFGGLYLSLTLAEYLNLVGDAAGGNGDLFVINWTGGDQVPAGNTITSPDLSGIVIFSVNKGGATIYQYEYTDGSPDGELDLTLDGGLSEAENIQILYKKA